MKGYRNILFLITIVLLFPRVSFPLTAEEVIKLKKAGVDNKTIQLMIQQEMQQEKLSDPYKNIGVREIKESDDRSAIIYSTGEIKDRGDYKEESERENREKAWEMLRNTVIDSRDREKNHDSKSRKE